jgi:RNA polymerase sigma factor (sigma-70 family)
MLDFLQQNEDLRIEDSIPDLEAPRSDAVTENRELQHHVARALALLPTAWRTSFVLYHVERQSLAQIAEVNGITEGEAKRHLQSAREYLRQILLESGVRLRRAGGTESQTKVERKGAR